MDVPVGALVLWARLEGHAVFNAHDDYDGAVRYTRFQTRLARPERAWKLVLRNVQGQEDILSRMLSPRVRAVLFDQDNVEQGRWQGRAIFEGDACAQSGVTLWQYLQLERPPSGPKPALRYTYVRGKAEPIAPRNLLPYVPDVIAVGDRGARCRAEKLPSREYRITYREHSLELEEYGGMSRAETTVFLCDDKGVLAASRFEAHRFSWDGKSTRMWAYPQPGLPSTAATLLVRGIAGKDAVLELQLPDENKAYRLTLPDWRAQSPVPEGMLAKWDSHCEMYNRFPDTKELMQEYDCAP
jgi:hypothetical protein